MTGLLPVRLLQVTDPHLFADESRELYGVNTGATFSATLAKGIAEAPGPLDAILVTGDIAEDGRRETYERFSSIVGALGMPVMCIPGNHDDRPAQSSLLNTQPLHYCGGVSFPGWRIVMLDSHVSGSDAGWLEDDELDRLDRELAAAAGQHVLICLHHQPLPIGSPWLDLVGLKNGAALAALQGKHGNVRGVLWGHIHQAFDHIHRGIRMMGTPSTCAQFTPNTQTCVMDLRSPGFRWLQLMPSGEIETAVVWLDELSRTERPPDSRRA